MSEVQFCKQFLSALDARPIKLSSDHIADARQYPAQSAYTLPRLPHPPHPARPNPRTAATAATASPDADASGSINVTLTPMKSTFPTVPISSVNLSTTSVFDLKQAYSTAAGVPAAKVKILWKKRPLADAKTVGEVIGQDAGGQIEFAVMILGGATSGTPGSTPVTSPPAVAPSEADKGLAGPAAQGPSGKEVVAGAEFWDDLKGFVVQRIRDEAEGERLVGIFKTAWEGDR